MKVDLIVKNALVYNTFFKEFKKNDVAILDGKFLYIGEKDMHILDAKEIIDAEGRHMVPGLIDIHMHIESSMATPASLSEAIIKHGITTIVSEPHEIANVLGINGVKEMFKASEECVVDIFYGVPSCVPSTSSEFETSGNTIDIDEIADLITDKRVVCLGEVMNYIDLARNSDTKIHRILEFMMENHSDKVIEGHCPELKGLELAKFIYSGVDSDHTQQTKESMLDRISNGMFVQLQHKSIKKEIIDVIREKNLFEYVSLVTDDVMACDFIDTGHLDGVLKDAMLNGLSFEEALYLATYTPARRMKLLDRGLIAPGRIADFILLDDTDKFDIYQTYKNGKMVYLKDEAIDVKEPYKYPEHFYNTIKLDCLNQNSLLLRAPEGNAQNVKCRIMEINDGTTYVKEVIKNIPIVENIVDWRSSSNCLVAVFERHGKNQNKTLALITGDTIKRGAVATTYAHDSHNLVVVGENIEDMILAANTVIASQGGYCVVKSGKVIAKIELPIGGILSENPMDKIGSDLRAVRDAMCELGYSHYSPIMSLSTHTLPVSPALKITDVGLVDVSNKKIVPLFIEE